MAFLGKSDKLYTQIWPHGSSNLKSVYALGIHKARELGLQERIAFCQVQGEISI
jgi:hypothetical protein